MIPPHSPPKIIFLIAETKNPSTLKPNTLTPSTVNTLQLPEISIQLTPTHTVNITTNQHHNVENLYPKTLPNIRITIITTPVSIVEPPSIIHLLQQTKISTTNTLSTPSVETTHHLLLPPHTINISFKTPTPFNTVDHQSPQLTLNTTLITPVCTIEIDSPSSLTPPHPIPKI